MFTAGKVSRGNFRRAATVRSVFLDGTDIRVKTDNVIIRMILMTDLIIGATLVI